MTTKPGVVSGSKPRIARSGLTDVQDPFEQMGWACYAGGLVGYGNSPLQAYCWLKLMRAAVYARASLVTERA